MSEIIAREGQKLTQSAVIELFDLDATSLGEGILRFTAGSPDGLPIQMGGYSYYPVPIESNGFDGKGQGTIPEPTLKMSVMSVELSQLIRSGGDLLGLKVTRRLTFSAFLDGGESPDPTAFTAPDVYYIDRKVSMDSRQVEFALSPDFDQRGYKIPGRQIIRDTCTHIYRVWDDSRDEWDYSVVTCPYTGDAMFDASGNSVTREEKDVCGKRLSECQRRFGTNAELPFYGFPGAGRL